MCVDDGGRRSTINLIQYLVKKEDAEKLKGGGEREKIEIWWKREALPSLTHMGGERDMREYLFSN